MYNFLLNSKHNNNNPFNNDSLSGTTRVSWYQKRNFCTLWCKGRSTEADTPTIRLGATPSGLASVHLHHPPFFYRPDALPATQPTVSKHWRQLAHSDYGEDEFSSTVLPATSLINFLYFLWSMVSSLHICRGWQSFSICNSSKRILANTCYMFCGTMWNLGKFQIADVTFSVTQSH